MKCRHCGAELSQPFIDLGSAPPSNAYLTERTLRKPEKWYPLRVLVCDCCWLVQTEDFADSHELFNSEYAYFSGFSTTWLEHCKQYVADVTERFALTRASHVVEVAANDGYLLQYVRARNILCTGIEPTAGTAAAARAKGIDIVEDFFGGRLAGELVARGKAADLMIANNVLAHVPDINDFLAGFALLLKPDGIATFEFPHLLSLASQNQFDTIYHEHFSYLSLTAVNQIMQQNGLNIFDVEKLSTHGGSLRVFAQRSLSGSRKKMTRVSDLLAEEMNAGMQTPSFYNGFQIKADRIKNDLLVFLLELKRTGKSVAAYGAAAKGNTLLNYAGIKPDLLPYVVDRNPAKLGKFLPGSRIPIVSEDRIRKRKPDFILILPWNIKEEVMAQLAYVREWGGRFVTAIPELVDF
ncbi:MAG: class I SAM-dependent methyltransferase [Deltaproteobacteria bacterium]|nr:class I SAM-dependent methyltransferase [Deltaproteobacteria bacterium]